VRCWLHVLNFSGPHDLQVLVINGFISCNSVTVLAQDEWRSLLIVSMDSGGRRGSRWGDWVWDGDNHTWKQSALNSEAWAQSAGPSITDRRTTRSENRQADTTHRWSGQQYQPSGYSQTAASSADRRFPLARAEPPYKRTARGKRGGLMNKNVHYTDAKTDEQRRRALQRQPHDENRRWFRLNNSDYPDPIFIDKWLAVVRKRMAYTNAMREQAASVSLELQPQDSHDDEPVSEVGEPAECLDDESDAELVLNNGDDEKAMKLNDTVPGFEVFKLSVLNTSDQLFELRAGTQWDHKYVILPLLVAVETAFEVLMSTALGFVELVQFCALLCYRMVYVDDARMLDHDEVMQLIASTLQAYCVPAEFLLLKEYLVWAVRCCSPSAVCGFGKKQIPVLWSLLDPLGMPLHDAIKINVEHEDSNEKLQGALSAVELMQRPSADAQSSLQALMDSVAEDIVSRDTIVPVIDLTLDSEPPSTRPQGSAPKRLAQPQRNHGSVAPLLPTKHAPLVIVNFLQSSQKWNYRKRGSLVIFSCYKSGSNLFQGFVKKQFDYGACQPGNVRTGFTLCDEIHFPGKNPGADTYLSVKDARCDMQDYSTRWQRKQPFRSLWKHHIGTAPTVILYPSDTLTIIYLVRNPYCWLHSLCSSQDKYEMYPKGCDPAKPGKGTRQVGKWEWLMSPIYINHPGDCKFEYGTKFHFGNAMLFWCEHVQGFLSGNVTIDSKTKNIFYLRAEDLVSQTRKVTEVLNRAGIPPKSSGDEPVLETRHVGPYGVDETTHESMSLQMVRDAIPPHVMTQINNELHKYPQIMDYLGYDYMDPSLHARWQSHEVRVAADLVALAMQDLEAGAVGIWSEVPHAD
jgi:hypothetical protein